MEVVSASHGVLGPLLGKLTAFLADECSRLKGVRREISHLKLELASMHAALKEYTKIEDPNEQLKMWISLLRELAYDTEDCFDKFIHKLSNDGDHGGFKAFLRETAFRLKTLGSRCGIADQIDDLKARIKHVKELKDAYKLDASTSSSSSSSGVDPRLHALFAEESHLVGIEGPRDDLVNWMVEEGLSKHHPRVLSIVGFGGLGKTTLANEVYRKIKGDFDCKAFVSVSQKPDIKNIMRDIIHQVTYPDGFTRDIDIWNDATSIAKLRELLQDKRYLVIVDDVWSTLAWDTIKCAFPENNCSSRIIVTTRIIDVAKSCCQRGDDGRMYKMKVLDDVHSRRLFFKRIFGSGDGCPEMMKEVSDKILKKCGGIPLAISTISSLLANKPVVKEEWEKVKRSIGSALEKNQSLEGMSHILSLSYNDLPSHLKTCLLYLSMFPEDYQIWRHRLVRLWIAEGFISEERERSPQEVAEQYFYELINRSMIQPEYITDDSEVYRCRVHDMMLELIISRAAEDNFITVVGSGQTSLASHQGLIRRLSVQHIDQELAGALANKDLSHVRSLIVTSSRCIKHLPSLDKFGALRVLHFEGCEEGVEEYITKGMDRLFLLKYLGLEGTGISELPPGIVKLRDLVTLDLRNTNLKELPPGIVQLIKLQHLLLSYQYYYKVPDGIGNMRNLQEVPQFDITRSSVDAVEELGNLSRLKTLSIRYDGMGSDKYKRHAEILLSSVHKLCSCKLQSLHIEGSKGSVEFIKYLSPLPPSLRVSYKINEDSFADIQKHIIPAAALTNLFLMWIHVTEISMVDAVQSLGGLPALSVLILNFKTGPKERLIVQDIGFPSLGFFELRGGAYITFAKGAMPKLRVLHLDFPVLLAKSGGFRLGIEHLPCLRLVTASLRGEGARTSSDMKAAAAALRKEADAHPNHPTITIYGEPRDEEGDDEKKSN